MMILRSLRRSKRLSGEGMDGKEYDICSDAGTRSAQS